MKAPSNLWSLETLECNVQGRIRGDLDDERREVENVDPSQPPRILRVSSNHSIDKLLEIYHKG